MSTCLLLVISGVLLTFFLLKVCMLLRRIFRRKVQNVTLSVGFFHPYCNAGGGGERVLWCAIQAIQNRYCDAHCTVYTGDDAPGDEILEKAERCFNIKLPKQVKFVHLKLRTFVEAKHYPFFTLLLQSLGSFILGLEAAFKNTPDIYIDTMGYAFTYPIFKHICCSRVGAYVHYPTISTDMLSTVAEKKVSVNNREFISKSRLLSYLKIKYYKIFAVMYSFVGCMAETIVVNSSWTRNHILELWQKPEVTFKVYPPCDVTQFEILPLKSDINKENLRIVSIAQFRPEKNHKLQISAFHSFLKKTHFEKRFPTLVLIGSCRNEEDYLRVNSLKSLCSEKGIEKNVEFKINLTFDEVMNEMKIADVSLHTMLNEHFGIGIVECMSAGLIMIAHDSGGPKLDIVKNKETGFLASDVDSYAAALDSVWQMNSEDLLKMRTAARDSVKHFSSSNFEETFLKATNLLFR